ncbi:uncharacterized protein YALI1_B18971g [Yarrowia lipolytica]|nr:hypothetical protein YALI1_B18971g [Yarrowia lipolytica]
MALLSLVWTKIGVVHLKWATHKISRNSLTRRPHLKTAEKKQKKDMARLARLATAQDYTVVDIRNVSQSLIRQMEWLEQEIQASANRVVQLEDNGDDEAEGPAQAAAPQVNNDELRADVQKKLTPLWQGSLKLTLSDSNQQLVYAIERVRVAQLHRRDIIGAKVSISYWS